jgi:hypothetical protein
MIKFLKHLETYFITIFYGYYFIVLTSKMKKGIIEASLQMRTHTLKLSANGTIKKQNKW